MPVSGSQKCMIVDTCVFVQNLQDVKRYDDFDNQKERSLMKLSSANVAKRHGGAST